ncbi:MAG TPA: SRPBCC domain-containing protein [Bacillota bacterium]|nr:SRPBCC domain-containing protein [Bacillota bacterium]
METQPLNIATTVKKAFSRTTAVAADIKAAPETIWALLTNAAEYPKWNSTVTSIEGSIEPGQTIKLKSTLDPKRVFKLKIKEFQAPNRLVWGDAMGSRVYTLAPGEGGVTRFSMVEKIGGPIFPLFAGMIPSFDKSFEQFAADLKKAAEH